MEGVHLSTGRIALAVILVLATAHSARADAQTTLPWRHRVEEPMSAQQVGDESVADGRGVLSAGATPALAVGDLTVFDADMETGFPMSADVDRSDSLRDARAARAGNWVTRVLLTQRGAMGDAAFRVMVEVAAGDTAKARVSMANLLATARSQPRRAFILATAIEALTDTLAGDSALLSRLAIAGVYLGQLERLPAGGYPTRRDSLAVLDWLLDAERSALAAVVRGGNAAQVMAQVNHLLGALQRYDARGAYLESHFPLEAVGPLLLSQSDGRARLSALKRRLEDFATAPARRRHGFDAWFLPTEALGNPTPAVSAHAWINTGDSIYGSTPRARRFDDGVIRVIVPRGGMCRTQCAELAPFERVQRRFGPRIETVVLAEGVGHALADIVDAPEEVAWLKALWVAREHYTMTFAVWVGAKHAAAFGGTLPAPSPLREYPWPGTDRFAAVAVDGRGIVRGYFPMATREDERALTASVEYLLDEAAGTASGQSLPRRLVPVTLAADRQ